MAIYDPVSIANSALLLCNIGQPITSLEDSSHRAQVLNREYEKARDAVLSRAQFTMADQRITLELVEEDPNDDWGFSYRYPQDPTCICLRRLVDLQGLPVSDPVPYVLSHDDQGILILTDLEDAVALFSAAFDNPALWSNLLAQAISAELAKLVAPGLGKADRLGYIEQKATEYRMEAQALSASEFQRHRPPESSYTTARGDRSPIRDFRRRY